MSKILSVSIAAYNVEKYIESALEPFAKDSLRDLVEVFIIDDGGKDRTLELARRYVDAFPEIFIPVHKENGGWGSTVNYGIEHATGKYFKQLDGDDFFNPKSLEDFVHYLDTIDADFVFSPFITFEDGTGKELSHFEVPSSFRMGQVYEYKEHADEIPLAMHSATFKTALLKENGLHIAEKCFYTDIEFIIKGIALVRTIAFFNQDVYQYRYARSGQSMSYQGLRKHYKEHLAVTLTIIQFINSMELPPRILKAVNDKLNDLINGQYSLFFILLPNRTHKAELVSFDEHVREHANQHYNRIVPYIRFARRFHFAGYSFWVGLRYVKHLFNMIRRGY